jgi:hypothetical protein
VTNVHRLPTAWHRCAPVLLAATIVIWVLLWAPCAAPAADVLTYDSYPYDLRDLGPAARPFSVAVAQPRVDPGVHDVYGVRMRSLDGVLYDFPRGQATWGLLNLSSYVVTHDTFYLDRALAQAQRLRETRVVAGDAWYFPNRPAKQRHGEPGEFIAAPYYSALAQGRVLMFFSRLAEVTGLEEWREAADHAFASFLRPGPCSGPYVMNVDARGCLWLQEWPWPGMRPDDTFNGHNSAAFGVYEYWHLTHDARALEVFRGAATTSQMYARVFRRPGWLSLYCLAHRDVNPFYHSYHVGQLLELYRMTGAVVFARYADQFSEDYPKPGLSTSMTVEPGRYAAVRFDGAGNVVDRRTVTARRVVHTRVTRRQRQVPGGDVYLRVAAAPWAGWWLAEQPDRVYADGAVVVRAYDPVRNVSLLAGRTYRAVLLDERGQVGDSVALQPDEPLPVSAGATVLGSPAVRLAAGERAKYWLLLEDGAQLR